MDGPAESPSGSPGLGLPSCPHILLVPLWCERPWRTVGHPKSSHSAFLGSQGTVSVVQGPRPGQQGRGLSPTLGEGNGKHTLGELSGKTQACASTLAARSV